ncbi:MULTISPECIES: hypothetical protein [Stutzerimonas stutzeri subgroup]|jgi:hypothetical protein|uniref:hypothetical protein n=1 Tax=Stutzerimonas stutzeri subgroup TaxID=578833 RepID=UPI000A97D9DC|nr:MULTISPECIES: hypothetical protein [Stutzerimonas stutzeri subgroup]
MRKINPQDVKAQFSAFVSERLAYFNRVETALNGTPHEKRDISVLAETTLHSTYVAFECFVSDLIVAYINRDFSQYQRVLATRISQSIDSKFGGWARSRTPFNAVKHIRIDDLERMLDPENYNLTFKSVEVLKQRCNEWIAAPYKDGIMNLTEADSRFIDTVHSVRNFIAHQSKNSKALMNDNLMTVVTGPNCPNLGLGRGVRDVHDVGAFLKSAFSGSRRITTYIRRLDNIAQTL